MKGVIWILACVVLVGCESRRLDTQTVESSGGVTRELATAVRRAQEAKRVEEGRLVQYGVEKQRLVSRLMPNGDWGDGHPLAIEGYVSERDPESAKNLSVVLEKRDRRQRTGRELPTAKDGASRKAGSKVPKQGQESQTKHSRRQQVPQTEGWR
jgi:hypothetical protein